MSERMNGKAPYMRRTHGSDRRGVKPIPDISFFERIQQSRQDIERLQNFNKQRKQEIQSAPQTTDLGNHELPAYKHKQELVAAIETSKAVIVGGETGSGKSTQLPQYLYEAGYDMTIMLVPRRVIADGLGERIREEMSSQIEDFNAEEEIGIIHGERVERHENNKILVMTPNTFIRMEADLREIYGDKKLAIVADEIHEANLFTEIAVGVSALAVRDEEKWRLIAASATHNSATLQEPFQKLNNGYVPTIEIKGRPFNVELIEEPHLNPMEAYARDGHNHEKAMIFTSGKKEIEYIIDETRRELEKVEKGLSNEVIFRVLHGDLTEVELSHINDPVPEGFRLVIVSSPAGMSGITIPGVTYVATDGTINRSELDDDNAAGLKRYSLSKAGVIQQIGRAGRDVPGGIGVLCSPVLTKRREDAEKQAANPVANKYEEALRLAMPYIAFNEREEHEPPEIYSTNLSRVVLSVAALNKNFSELNEFIPHPVQKIDIINAEEALARIGALDDDNKITPIGKKMDSFPVSPELSRGLVEATGNNRSLQHMARAAFIAAAIDVSGLQDHYADEDAVRRRKQLIRPTTSDDFIAQLDLMTKLFEHTTEKWSGYEFVERHGLHPKRVERVRKLVRKILNVSGIKLRNVIVTEPVADEEQLLRDDFTAGFIDYIYEDVGLENRTKQVLYRNIHGDENSTLRKISDRSEASIPRGSLTAGMPRWYTKGFRKDGTPIKYNIIDTGFEVDKEVVSRHAINNGLVRGVWKESRVVDGRVVDYVQGTFGSLQVGAPIEQSSTEAPSRQARDALVEYVLIHKGRTQKALRELASELEDYRNSIPASTLTEMRRPDAPVSDITQESITNMIREAAKTTTTTYGIEDALANISYSRNITLARYYDPENILKFNEISPTIININGTDTPVRYENANPYLTNLTKSQIENIKQPLFLSDGREILYQRKAQAGGVERVSFGFNG